MDVLIAVAVFVVILLAAAWYVNRRNRTHHPFDHRPGRGPDARRDLGSQAGPPADTGGGGGFGAAGGGV